MASPTYTSACRRRGQAQRRVAHPNVRKKRVAVAIAARDAAKLAPRCTETPAAPSPATLRPGAAGTGLFADIEREYTITCARTLPPTRPGEVQDAHCRSPRSGSLVAQQAAARMLPKSMARIPSDPRSKREGIGSVGTVCTEDCI